MRLNIDRDLVKQLGTLSSQDEFVDDDERRRVRSGSRTESKAGKTNVKQAPVSAHRWSR